MTKTRAMTVPGQQALAVRIGEHLHALAIDVIEEILPALPIEAVSQCPSFVRGVISVRGQLIPVLDAADRLGLQNHVRPEEPHIVCLRVGSRLVGLEVDEAVDLIVIPLTSALPVEELNAQGGFLAGLVECEGRVIRILDVDKVIAHHEANAIERLPKTASKSP